VKGFTTERGIPWCETPYRPYTTIMNACWLASANDPENWDFPSGFDLKTLKKDKLYSLENHIELCLFKFYKSGSKSDGDQILSIKK